VRALRVRIDALTPAEYGALDAWDYDEIQHCQHEWREANRLYPPGWDSRKPQRPEGTG
jgi:hypothetical protein